MWSNILLSKLSSNIYLTTIWARKKLPPQWDQVSGWKWVSAHPQTREWTNIMTMRSAQILWQRGLSACELTKSGIFGKGGMWPEFRFHAFHVSAPCHPILLAHLLAPSPPPFPLSHPGEGGWIRGVLRASKFLQLMDLCLGISHLGLLQICAHPIMATN